MRDARLDGAECPPALVYLWTWFCEVSHVRGGGLGLMPLAWSEIDAWCRVTRRRLSHFERQALCVLDRKFMEIMSEK